MYTSVLFVHGWLRWLVLLAGLLALVSAITGVKTRRPWTPDDDKSGLWFIIALDLQFLIGLVLYGALSPVTAGAFIDMAAACELMLTNDSGAMHIASALGVPTVTVFGATDWIATGPTGPLARIVREEVECAPCLKRECPLGHHRCMDLVSSDRVAHTALELLK